MITEHDRLRIEDSINDEKKSWFQQVIDASSRYERLLVIKDFRDMMDDLKKVAELHQSEISRLLSESANCDNFFKKMRIDHVILKHQIRKEQIEEAVSYPQKLVHEATKAREGLSILKEQENAHV